MSQTLFTNISQSQSFNKEFENNLKSSNSLVIASGYFGESTILNYEKKLKKIGLLGDCRILIGMAFHGGVTQKQNDALIKIHETLQSDNMNNGIYISRKPYHGKIYSFDGENDGRKIYVGSSNFSKEGLLSRYECSVLIDKEQTKNEITNYLNKLFNAEITKPLHEVDLRIKSKKEASQSPSTLLSDYIVPLNSVPDVAAAQGSFNIELQVDNQPASSLNLYFDKGRKNPSTGLYQPRPWYEVEIGTNKQDRENNLYPLSHLIRPEGNSRNGEFIAYAKDGDNYYKLNMVVSADFGKNIASSRESGGRATLGKYIKGKLEKAGVLQFGERITSETLSEYGKNFITFTKINNSTYIIDF